MGAGSDDGQVIFISYAHENGACTLNRPPGSGPWVCQERENCPEYIGAAVDRMISTDPQNRDDSVSAPIIDMERSDLDVEVVRDSYRRLLKSPDQQTAL